MIVERFAIAQDHEPSAARPFCGNEEISPLANRRGHSGARLSDDRGVEIIEEQFDRTVVRRER